MSGTLYTVAGMKSYNYGQGETSWWIYYTLSQELTNLC